MDLAEISRRVASSRSFVPAVVRSCFLAAAACSTIGEATAPPAPTQQETLVAVSGVRAASYYPYAGDYYPTEAGASAEIDEKITDILLGDGCDSGNSTQSCEFKVTMWTAGLWNGTEQEMTYSVAGNQSPPRKFTDDFCQRWEVSLATDASVCGRKVADNEYPVTATSACGKSISATTNHTAWFTGVISLSVGVGPIRVPVGYGRTGEISKGSVSPTRNTPACSSSGGGEPAAPACFDVWQQYLTNGGQLAYEVYLGNFCNAT